LLEDHKYAQKVGFLTKRQLDVGARAIHELFALQIDDGVCGAILLPQSRDNTLRIRLVGSERASRCCFAAAAFIIRRKVEDEKFGLKQGRFVRAIVVFNSIRCRRHPQ
jgi:hypothetical protein